MKHDYEIKRHPVNGQDITVHLPEKMLKDLVLRSMENGRDIHVEIMIRLARTLENDLDRIAEDAFIEALAKQNSTH